MKKVSKASKRRLIIFGTLSFLMIGYSIFCAFDYIINLKRLSNEEKSLINKLDTLKSNEQSLQLEIQKLKDPDYLARYARENYLYSKNGEYIIKMEPKLNNNNIKTISSINYKIIGFISGLLVIIVIYNIKKKKQSKA